MDYGSAPLNAQDDTIEEPKVGMIFNTDEEAYLYYAKFAKKNGFAVAKRSCKKIEGEKINATFECTHAGKPTVKSTTGVKPRPHTKTGCRARLNLARNRDGTWRISTISLEHNHDHSPGKYKFYKSNRVLNESVKKKLILYDQAGIRLNKSYESFQIQAGGHENLSFTERDCRNYLYGWRNSQLVEGDAEAMRGYFKKMKADNSDFFYEMDWDNFGRLRNVFWADARSRAACKEFGDVVTFDTTFLTNKYGLPFAPFIGVNHHGQSILLGCGLISHEDTESFSWLFNTWKECMSGCEPHGIITDQCMAMKNAIEQVFPDIRHRWCIWHIMKKVSEKLGSCRSYGTISYLLSKAVNESLTIEEFEVEWNAMINEYNLEENQWLSGLYLERKRWVPAFLKDVFWAGMSSTQRSEGMNHYFKGYIGHHTTLKQFVEQYENLLGRKVYNEKKEDDDSVKKYIPTIAGIELEKQFHSVYTNAKVREFQDQFVGKVVCFCVEKYSTGDLSKYEVTELVTYGNDGRQKNVLFQVIFNSETNEVNCDCRLFEFRGMVCKHQLTIWHERRVHKVPEKYILRRWRKDVKRVHSQVRINYAKPFRPIEYVRNENICNKAAKIADLVDANEENYAKVMSLLHDLEEELHKTLFGTDSDIHDDEADVPSEDNRTILDPLPLRRRGRPSIKRLEGVVAKICKKKTDREKKKKELEKEKKKKEPEKKKKKSKNIVNEVLPDKNSEVFQTQHNFPIYMDQMLWPHIGEGDSIPFLSMSLGGQGRSMPNQFEFF